MGLLRFGKLFIVIVVRLTAFRVSYSLGVPVLKLSVRNLPRSTVSRRDGARGPSDKQDQCVTPRVVSLSGPTCVGGM